MPVSDASDGSIMTLGRFSLKKEGFVLAIVSYGLPAIGLIALLVLWLTGYLQ